MPLRLRPSMIDDIPLIDALDNRLFADTETYPFSRPIFGYYAARTLGGNPGIEPQREEKLLLAPMDMRFFSIFREGHLAGFMVLRNWVDQSDFSRGRYDERDSEVMYLGIEPDFRGHGLGSEALAFALQDHARRHRHGRTLARFKPGCTVFQGMLDRAGFELYPWPRDGRMIGVRYSYDLLFDIPHPE